MPWVMQDYHAIILTDASSQDVSHPVLPKPSAVVSLEWKEQLL